MNKLRVSATCLTLGLCAAVLAAQSEVPAIVVILTASRAVWSITPRSAKSTRANVSQLQVAWRYESGDASAQSEIECTPTEVNGTLYLTTPKLRLIALNGATGQVKWTFNPARKVRW